MEKARPHRKPWRPSTREPGHTPTLAHAGSICHLPKERAQSAMRSRALSSSAPQAAKAIRFQWKLRPWQKESLLPRSNDLLPNY